MFDWNGAGVWRPVWGEEEEIADDHDELLVELEQAETGRRLNVRFCVFADGVVDSRRLRHAGIPLLHEPLFRDSAPLRDADNAHFAANPQAFVIERRRGRRHVAAAHRALPARLRRDGSGDRRLQVHHAGVSGHPVACGAKKLLSDFLNLLAAVGYYHCRVVCCRRSKGLQGD